MEYDDNDLQIAAPRTPAPFPPPAQVDCAPKAAQSAYEKAKEGLDDALDLLANLPTSAKTKLQRALRPEAPTAPAPQGATAPKPPVSLVVGDIEKATATIREVVRKLNDILAQVEL
jgi:hypothetical protein